MSIQAIAAVFQLDLPPLSKWVLACLADNADGFGGNIFPTITTLSQKSSIPERTLQRHLKALVESRMLEVVRVARRPTQHAPGRGTEYRLSFMTNPMASAPKPNYRSCPPKLRLEVIEAYAQTCTYCGRVGTEKDPDGQSWHIDRIIPGSRGGAYSPENIALSCGRCNIRKGATVAPIPTPDLGAKRIEMGAKEFDTGAKSPSMGAIAMAHDPSLEPSEDPPIDPLDATALFLFTLKNNPAYSHVDIDREVFKMQAWLALPANKDRKLTSRFILRWLNKIDRPLVVGSNGNGSHAPAHYVPNDAKEVCVRCFNTGTERTHKGSRICDHKAPVQVRV